MSEYTHIPLAEVTTLPLRTRKGTMWHVPVPPPSSQRVNAMRRRRLSDGRCTSISASMCEFCPYETQCREAVAHGDFIACERALAREVLP